MPQGLISSPLQVQSNHDFPVVQYADDTFVLIQADTRQLLCLKALINTFASTTGLKVNYLKSAMIPLNISKDRVHLFSRLLTCSRGSLHFTYLGTPVGLYKPSMEQCLPLIDRITKG